MSGDVEEEEAADEEESLCDVTRDAVPSCSNACSLEIDDVTMERESESLPWCNVR